MKALSARQAQSCEEAKHPKCRCRCGGAAHGAKRGLVTSLPLSDPHSPAQKCKACKGEGIRHNYLGIPGNDVLCDKCGGVGRVIPPQAAQIARQVRDTLA